MRLRAGVELNLNASSSSDNFINSNEVSYTNTISIPRLLYPFHKVDERKLSSDQTFFNSGVAATDRIGLFKLNSFLFGMGYEFNFSPNRSLTLKLSILNIQDCMTVPLLLMKHLHKTRI